MWTKIFPIDFTKKKFNNEIIYYYYYREPCEDRQDIVNLHESNITEDIEDWLDALEETAIFFDCQQPSVVDLQHNQPNSEDKILLYCMCKTYLILLV